jgi:hypothetical protein
MKCYEKLLALAAVVLTLPLLAAGQQDATRLAPVKASLMQNLDASKVHNGDEVRAKLKSTVHLANGTKLASGTILTGHVTEDQVNQQGTSKLGLCFDQALLKDGKSIPIKAMLVGASQPPYQTINRTTNYMWSPGTRQVDQIDALPGIDLHSRVSSKNSGVFVSSKKDLKLDNASQLEFAVGPQSGA